MAMIFAARRGKVILRALPGWFVMVRGLIALFLVAPNGVGDGLGLDYRLPPLVLLLAVADPGEFEFLLTLGHGAAPSLVHSSLTRVKSRGFWMVKFVPERVNTPRQVTSARLSYASQARRCERSSRWTCTLRGRPARTSRRPRHRADG